MKSLSKYPVSCCFHCPTIFSSSGSLILGEQIVQIDESEDQLALSNNKPNFNLPQFPSSSPQFSYLASPSFFPFSFHHENHHHSLLNHIFIVFPSPPPPPPPFYCFPSSSMFPLPHLHISIVFPTPPPQCTFQY